VSERRDGGGVAVLLTGGNRNDVTQLIPLLRAIPPIRGWPRSKPSKVDADRGYDHDAYRALVREPGITPVIARRGAEHGSGLGKTRWVVEPASSAGRRPHGLQAPRPAPHGQ
jgi:transposase